LSRSLGDLLDLLAPANVDLDLGVVEQVAVHAILDEGVEVGERHADLLVGSDVRDGDLGLADRRGRR
jgi:hypothetical protein